MKLTVSATERSNRPTQTWNMSSIVLSSLKPENKTGDAFRARNEPGERHKAPESGTKQRTLATIKRTKH